MDNLFQTVCKAWTVEQLREYLASTCIHAELVQVTSQSNLLVLATFRTSVADLLYPIEDEIGVCIQRPVSLLMDATDRFPVSSIVGVVVQKKKITLLSTNKEVSIVRSRVRNQTFYTQTMSNIHVHIGLALKMEKNTR